MTATKRQAGGPFSPLSRVSCPAMNAEQINAVGGWCELVGVGFLVRDLMSLARYRGKRKEWAALFREWTTRFRAWWVATPVMAWWRRLLGRPHPVVFVDAGAASMTMAAGDATVSTGGVEPFIPRRERTLREEIAELGSRVNQLQEQFTREQQERERAIAAERQNRREELRAEAQRLESQIAEVRRDVEGLRDATTGDLGLRAESVVFLVLGITLTTWSELFADWLGEWPPFRIAMSFLGGYVFARICWAWWRRQREAEMRNGGLERPAGAKR